MESGKRQKLLDQITAYEPFNEQEEQDRELIYKNTVKGAVCYDTSPEKFCTYLSGISDNFRLIYGSVFGLSQEAKEATDET